MSLHHSRGVHLCCVFSTGRFLRCWRRQLRIDFSFYFFLFSGYSVCLRGYGPLFLFIAAGSIVNPT